MWNVYEWRDTEKGKKQTELSTRPKRDVYKPIEY